MRICFKRMLQALSPKGIDYQKKPCDKIMKTLFIELFKFALGLFFPAVIHQGVCVYGNHEYQVRTLQTEGTAATILGVRVVTFRGVSLNTVYRVLHGKLPTYVNLSL